ncbi:MAG: TolC family protein [Gemmatimonadota bacterium]
MNNASRPLVVVLVLMGIVNLRPLAGQTSEPSDGNAPVERVTLEEALARFAQSNLELAVARSRLGQALASAAQAGAFPNPELSSTSERLGNAGADLSETYLNVSQRVEWSGARGARRASALHAAQAAAHRLEEDSTRLAFKVKSAYVEALMAEARLEALEEAAATVRRVEVAGIERLEEGDISAYEVQRLGLERARFELALAASELEVEETRRALGSLISSGDRLRPAAPVEAISGTPPPVSLADLLTLAREAHPAVRASEEEVLSAMEGLRAVERGRLPNPTLTGGYKTQSDDFQGVFLGISLPVPLFDRSRGAIESQAAQTRAAEDRVMLERQRVEWEVVRTFERYTSLRAQAGEVRPRLLLPSADLLEIAQLAYEEGAMSLLELLDATEAFRYARTQTAELDGELWIAFFDLERAANGADLDTAQTEGGE